MQTNSLTNKLFLATLVLLIIPISGLSIDIYIPSLPAVTHFFNTDKSMVQLSVTVYMIGIGIMQLFAGGISDSFGRKIPYTIAMGIFIAATLLIPFSRNIYDLLILRFIQGCFIAIAIVPIRSVMTDLFTGRELYKMSNYMTMAWSIGPIIAPAIGGYLQVYFGWKANFYFLAIYSLMIFTLTLFFLPETSEHRHPFHIGEILKRYAEILMHPLFLAGILINGLLYSIIMIFNVVAPFLIQSVLHYSAIEFGHIALLMGLAWFMGTMTNRFLLDVAIETKTIIGLSLMLLVNAGMLVSVLFTPLNIYSISIPMFIQLWIGGVIFPNNFARGLSLFPRTTGSANALIGAFIFFIAGLGSVFGALLKSTSALPLVIANIAIILVCLLIHYFISKTSSKVE